MTYKLDILFSLSPLSRIHENERIAQVDVGI